MVAAAHRTSPRNVSEKVEHHRPATEPWPEVLQPKIVWGRLRRGVLDVLAGPSLGALRLRLGVDIRIQEADGFVQGHGLVSGRSFAGLHITTGTSRGHVPFQAVELDFDVAAHVKRGDTIFQAKESAARFS